MFNVAQIHGLPESFTVPAETTEFNTILEAEQILISSGAEIRHGFDGPFYVPSKDQICLPARERFATPENYYATALHKLTHWTAHESRLNRQFGKRFGGDAYAVTNCDHIGWRNYQLITNCDEFPQASRHRLPGFDNGAGGCGLMPLELDHTQKDGQRATNRKHLLLAHVPEYLPNSLAWH